MTSFEQAQHRDTFFRAGQKAFQLLALEPRMVDGIPIYDVPRNPYPEDHFSNRAWMGGYKAATSAFVIANRKIAAKRPVGPTGRNNASSYRNRGTDNSRRGAGFPAIRNMVHDQGRP